jgi:hypothetical protein
MIDFAYGNESGLWGSVAGTQLVDWCVAAAQEIVGTDITYTGSGGDFPFSLSSGEAYYGHGRQSMFCLTAQDLLFTPSASGDPADLFEGEIEVLTFVYRAAP